MNWYGTGGYISTGDHPPSFMRSKDTSSTLFVTGVGLGYSMICFENPQLTSFMTPLAWFVDL